LLRFLINATISTDTFLWYRGIRISAVSKQLRNATIKIIRVSYIVGAVFR
jgi:hypothetical protein